MLANKQFSICLFCGSREGKEIQYAEQAKALGHLVAQQKWRLIYGGGGVGLMGVAAKTCLAEKGQVVGVIPESLLALEKAHPTLTELFVTKTMHERKQKMFELADAFVVLPGGFGTLDEVCEMVTWAQLGYHQKPIYLVNVNNFWNLFLKQLDHIVGEGFLPQEQREKLIAINSVEELLGKVQAIVQS